MTDRKGGQRDTAPGALDRLLAEAEIARVLVAYCQGVDRQDWQQVVSCYHHGATDSHTEGGPLELIAYLESHHKNVSFCMHVLSNISIAISNDDPSLARVESYCISRKTVGDAGKDPYLRASGATGPANRTVACRYVDTFANLTGVGWRIRDRTVVHEWMRSDPAEARLPFSSDIEVSRRDRSDLLYAPLLTRVATLGSSSDRAPKRQGLPSLSTQDGGPR